MERGLKPRYYKRKEEVPARVSLKGDTKTMLLPDLLRYLSSRQITGTLELSVGSSWRHLSFEKGRIVSSASSDPSEVLGQFLISENKITEDELTQAMEVQKKTKVLLGKILVMIGAVTQEDLIKMLERKCKESVYSTFLWDQAEFKFKDNELPSIRLIPMSMEVEPLVNEGMRRNEEWKILRQTYPSRKICFAKSSTSMTDVVAGDPFLKTVFDLVDSHRTVSDLIMQTRATDYKVLRALNELRNKNLVTIVNYGKKEEPESPTTVDDSHMIEMGKNKLSFGKWEEAINLFQYVITHGNQNQEAKNLLKRAEDGLLQSIYETTLKPDSIPRLATSLDLLFKQSLTSEENFLVTRINGRWTVKAIINITPLSEVDAVRTIKRLIDRKLVTL